MYEETEKERTKYSFRPPTKRMIEKLKECLEKETSNIQIPCLPEDMKSSLAGLYKRGFINTKMEKVNNKRVLCIYVTDEGKNFLSSYKYRKK
ncbi:MAG TPA: hypothetical protein VLI68_00380 [Hanamia sp.]|jgi:hypothetical protein|nr:hypothetical protein [Hanamia sp.]